MADLIENRVPNAPETGSPFEGWREHAAVDVPFGGFSTALKHIEGGEAGAKFLKATPLQLLQQLLQSKWQTI